LRIYTEDVNRQGTEALLQRHLQGYTLFPGHGFLPSGSGQKIRENSLVIETTDHPREVVLSLVLELKHLNRQESVLVIHLENNAEFLLTRAPATSQLCKD
jgi:hypothetical protein